MACTMVAITEIPGMALLFLLNHWQTIVAAVWGVGFVYLAYRAMVRWWREDASEARALSRTGDEGEIYELMKQVKQPKRRNRVKYIFTRCLFWLPLLAFEAVRAIGAFLIYPILLVLDRVKADAVRNAAKEKSKSVARAEEVESLAGATGAYVDCSLCHKRVSVDATHQCESPRVCCKRCSRHVEADKVHSCANVLAEEEDNEDDYTELSLECPDCCEEMIPDRIHTCTERVVKAVCRQCDEVYDPDDEDHTIGVCTDCDKTHCVSAFCS